MNPERPTIQNALFKERDKQELRARETGAIKHPQAIPRLAGGNNPVGREAKGGNTEAIARQSGDDPDPSPPVFVGFLRMKVIVKWLDACPSTRAACSCHRVVGMAGASFNTALFVFTPLPNVDRMAQCSTCLVVFIKKYSGICLVLA